MRQVDELPQSFTVIYRFYRDRNVRNQNGLNMIYKQVRMRAAIGGIEK
jgi:hypothetical protein